MSLPSSLLTGLAEFWLLTEGSGDIAHGFKGVLDMALSGSDRGTSGVDGLWLDSAHAPGFCGKGSADWPEAWPFTDEGDVVTIAVEHWWAGGRHSIDTWMADDGVPMLVIAPFDGTPSTNVIVRIHDATMTDRLRCEYEAVDPPPEDPAFDVHIYLGVGIGEGNGVDTFIEAPPFDEPFDPYIIIFEAVRLSGGVVRVRMYLADGQTQTDGTTTYTNPFDVLQFNGPDNFAAWRRSALWLRGLSLDERSAIFAHGLAGLAGLEANGDPTQFVDADGNSALPPALPITRENIVAVIATDGGSGGFGHRHARSVNERSKRRYDVTFELLGDAQWERIRTVLDSAKGGANWFRWRHPTDDAPGTEDDAPLWRVVMDRGGPKINRSEGGQRGTVSMTLEEV